MGDGLSRARRAGWRDDLHERALGHVGFGVVRTDGDGRLKAYEEKPELRYEVSMGVNVLSAWAIERFVERRTRLDMPDLLRRITPKIRDGARPPDGRVLARHGRMADLEAAIELFESDPSRFLP